jgi:tryptophanyl-tRNA synthetase
MRAMRRIDNSYSTADIGRLAGLLYDTEYVPVDGDQSQHVALAGDLAERFNALYGDTFTVPALAPAAIAARVRDLADPAKKMSKSTPGDAPGVIRMLDPADVIRRKLRRAVTTATTRCATTQDASPVWRTSPRSSRR